MQQHPDTEDDEAEGTPVIIQSKLIISVCFQRHSAQQSSIWICQRVQEQHICFTTENTALEGRSNHLHAAPSGTISEVQDGWGPVVKWSVSDITATKQAANWSRASLCKGGTVLPWIHKRDGEPNRLHVLLRNTETTNSQCLVSSKMMKILLDTGMERTGKMELFFRLLRGK